MSNAIDLANIISQANDLLSDLQKANSDFAKKSDASVKEIESDLKEADVLSVDLSQAGAEAVEKIDEAVLTYLAKSEE